MSVELLVSRVGRQTWAAIRENGRTVELRVELESDDSRTGRIVKARVTKVVPALQSAFVDVGLSRDAFLHAPDLVLPGETKGLVAAAGAAPELPPIEDRLREGRELLVQIARETPRGKGDRVTCRIGIPGHLLVLFPQALRHGVSRRVTDSIERERLSSTLERLAPAGFGLVARTAAEGAPESALEADAHRLLDTWNTIQRKAAKARAPCVVYQDLDQTLRLLRDAPRQGLDRIVIEDPEDRERAVRYLAHIEPDLASRIQAYEGPGPMLEGAGIADEVERALKPRVWLESGGYLVIEQTEALVSIDVNTGKSVRGKEQEKTILATNLEAAPEIARQLRLRDLGGIIVIDLIDMDSPESRRQVVGALADALQSDPARTNIVGLSELGLLQLTRRRTRTDLASTVTRPCPTCSGEGWIKRPEVVAGEALLELNKLAGSRPSTELHARAHPAVAAALREMWDEPAHPGSTLAVDEERSWELDRYEVWES